MKRIRCDWKDLKKMNKLVSIAEFAKMCGKPKAEVYKMLAEEANKPFVSVVDGMKMVDTAILDKKPEAEVKKEEFAEMPHQSTDEASLNATITALTARIEELEEIIIEKDRTIQEMSLKMADMAVSTQAITEKALNAVNQQQILTAIATKKLPWYRRLLGIGRKDEEEIRM